MCLQQSGAHVSRLPRRFDPSNATCEVGYKSLANATCEVLWVQTLLDEVEITHPLAAQLWRKNGQLEAFRNILNSHKLWLKECVSELGCLISLWNLDLFHFEMLPRLDVGLIFLDDIYSSW
jgi:hypothetical protein